MPGRGHRRKARAIGAWQPESWESELSDACASAPPGSRTPASEERLAGDPSFSGLPPFQLELSRSACLGDGLEGFQIAGPLRSVIFTNARNPALCHRPRQLEQLRDLARDGESHVSRRGQGVGTAPAGPSARACSHPRSPPYPGHGQRGKEAVPYSRFEGRASWAEAFIALGSLAAPAASLQTNGNPWILLDSEAEPD